MARWSWGLGRHRRNIVAKDRVLSLVVTLCTEEESDDCTSADYDQEHNIDGGRFKALAQSP